MSLRENSILANDYQYLRRAVYLFFLDIIKAIQDSDMEYNICVNGLLLYTLMMTIHTNTLLSSSMHQDWYISEVSSL